MEVIAGKIPEWVSFAGSGSGSGSGSGYGYGSGSGSGSGYGSGDGYGDGSGDGSGYGSGYGDGPGDGSGDGDGDGYGYGYGDGSGSGDGYGDGSGSGDGSGDGDGYLEAVINQTLGPSKADELRDMGVTLAFWRSDLRGNPANGGHGTHARVGLVEEIRGPLEICTSRALHGSMRPLRWVGQRMWIVALYPPVQWEDDKCASLKREILAEVPNWFA